jgi:hypothetical protein
MAVPKKILKLVQARDSACWHCGAEDDLVPHHRKNRGMGGSKLLDTPDNLLLVCSRWNGDMESDAELAATARGWGHKLPVWESLEHPVFDRVSFTWWFLLPDGTKLRSDWNDQPF